MYTSILSEVLPFLFYFRIWLTQKFTISLYRQLDIEFIIFFSYLPEVWVYRHITIFDFSFPLLFKCYMLTCMHVFIYVFCMCHCMRACVMAPIRSPEVNLREFIFFFYHVGTESWIQDVRLVANAFPCRTMPLALVAHFFILLMSNFWLWPV